MLPPAVRTLYNKETEKLDVVLTAIMNQSYNMTSTKCITWIPKAPVALTVTPGLRAATYPASLFGSVAASLRIPWQLYT